MSNLSPEAAELVRAVKAAYRPRDADRTHVLEALRARLGDALLAGDGLLRSAAAARKFWSPASGLATVGLAVLTGSLLWLALRSEPGSSPAQPGASISLVAPAASSAPVAPAASLPSDLGETVAPPASQANPPRPAVSRRVRDSLADEIAILSRAETDLHGNRPESALKALDEHERKFGNGVLAEERTAARIQALCALGRTAQAEAELENLARISPRSPHTARARQACRRNQAQ